MQQRHQRQQFGRAAVLRDQHRGIARLVDSEVAVHRFGRVQEDRRRSRAAQRGDDLARDVPRLANARDHDLAGVVQNEIDRADEFAVQTRRGAGERSGFDFDGGPRGGEPVLFRIGHSRTPSPPFQGRFRTSSDKRGARRRA